MRDGEGEEWGKKENTGQAREAKKTLTAAETDASFPMTKLVCHSNWDVKEKR